MIYPMVLFLLFGFHDELALIYTHLPDELYKCSIPLGIGDNL